MQTQFMETIRVLVALLAGSLIGLGFGFIQNLALRRNQKLQQSGALKDGWTVMPGSMRRVAYLLVALILVQLLCPLLFVNGTQWWVSAGVVLGYGALLFRRLFQR
jgi:hypothetical protein